MPFDKARLIQIMKEELNRQAQISRSMGLYVYGDDSSDKEIGVDGMLDLEAFAQAIINSEPHEWRPNKAGWYCVNCPGSSFTREWIREKKPCPSCNKMGGYAYHIILG